MKAAQRFDILNSQSYLSAMNSKSYNVSAYMRRFALAALLSIFFLSASFAYDVTVAWDPNEEPNLEGYTIHYNIESPGPPFQYSNDVAEQDLANPLNPMVTITDLQDNTKYYVAATAYDTSGKESQFSEEVCVQIINSVIDVCGSSPSPVSNTTSSSGGGGGGGGGGGCFISTAIAQNPAPQSSIHRYLILSVTLLLLLIIASSRATRS